MSEEDPYVVVPNWRRFQHYGDRNPPWLKLYTELQSRDDWRALSLAERGLLVTIWIEFARSRGQLRLSDVAKRAGTMTRKGQVESLSDAGFIRLRASRPLALRARARRGRDRVRTPPSPPFNGGAEKSLKRKPRVTGWREVRGSHGRSVVPDPLGTDPGPK